MKEVERILRVDHAGECGAINVYKSQLFVARYLYKDIVPVLEEMLAHEKEHYQIFDKALKERELRHCYAIKLWSIGGTLLGILTALAGRKAVWTCTESIETTVLHHLEHQLEFLKKIDAQAFDVVQSIIQDEEEHRDISRRNGSDKLTHRPIYWCVKNSVQLAINLSTRL
ncbi:MAG: demethoxyubiquinone hydroxylase family protein [Kangiellaceae bacterium]|nr:demethoxyubiquinone hydroxylase family protein [Kangiellaceae bacterium]MCW8997289.1 demethoxyubiquinone hydroxylase family protein [Kangiellaceae bacterium]MCW9015583.1 demethoxyubiquinone hydroxylase family protein [Kangiellaceae bacterium]